MSFFRPTGGQLHINATATPTTPQQLMVASGWQNAEQQMVIRTLIFNASGSTEVHIAYAPTSAQAAAIAGAGGDTTAGVQDGGVLTFGAAPATTFGGIPDYISIPANSWLSVWCAVASQTADVYICPGEETAH